MINNKFDSINYIINEILKITDNKIIKQIFNIIKLNNFNKY